MHLPSFPCRAQAQPLQEADEPQPPPQIIGAKFAVLYTWLGVWVFVCLLFVFETSSPVAETGLTLFLLPPLPGAGTLSINHLLSCSPLQQKSKPVLTLHSVFPRLVSVDIF